MLFNSLQFLIFFPVVTALYFASPQRFRRVLLPGMSLVFYAWWQPAYLLVLLACIGAAYIGARGIERSNNGGRTLWLVGAIAVPLGMLLLFKYYNFFAGTFEKLSRRVDSSFTAPALRLALPVGISFYTFKAVSYLADVYKGKQKAERGLGAVATYISFFPQILAGPIERAGNFLPQLNVKHRPDWNRITDGLALMLWGLFKKAVIADNLATVVNWVYLEPQNYHGLPLVIATYCYAFQILCDFSGYSDMAIGAARVLGFSTMRNFNRPYAAASVGEFWRRWHISLSTWFRDYVYIPLGGSRVPAWKWGRNVLIVFLISGLWHGSYWTFCIWGGLHGLFLIGERLLARPVGAAAAALKLTAVPRLATALRVLITFHLVTFSWIFFRATAVTDAFYVAGHLFDNLIKDAGAGLSLFADGDLALAALLIATLMTVQFLRRATGALAWLRARPTWVRWCVYAALILAIINLRPEYDTGFIYLQF